MSYVHLVVCDRCGMKMQNPNGASGLGPGLIQAGWLGTIFPIPKGHLSRVEPTSCSDVAVNVCPACHESFNRWWKNEVLREPVTAKAAQP